MKTKITIGLLGLFLLSFASAAVISPGQVINQQQIDNFDLDTLTRQDVDMHFRRNSQNEVMWDCSLSQRCIFWIDYLAPKKEYDLTDPTNPSWTGNYVIENRTKNIFINKNEWFTILINDGAQSMLDQLSTHLVGERSDFFDKYKGKLYELQTVSNPDLGSALSGLTV